MNMRCSSLCATGLLLLFAATAAAQPEKPAPPPAAQPYKLSGLMFGDYYAFAQSHRPDWEGEHGFWLRRLYFTYDHTFTPKVSTRFRLEANSNGKRQGGALEPYVKDAYVRWNAFGRQALMLGIQPSLSFEFVESIWGLRHIEKTPLDLYRWDGSRDFGVTLTGPLNAKQTIKYGVQFGNESGNGSETDEFKGYRASLRYETNPGFSVEGVVGQFNRERGADRTLAQVFGAYRTARGRAGLQYSFHRRRAADGTTAADTDLDILSGFVVYDMQPRKSSVFLRVDRYADPCPDCAGIDYLPIDTRQRFTTTIAGAEFFVAPAVRISPNLEWVKYGTPPAGGDRPDDDRVFRLTFFWTW